MASRSSGFQSRPITPAEASKHSAWFEAIVLRDRLMPEAIIAALAPAVIASRRMG
jgi:hypothetical protein